MLELAIYFLILWVVVFVALYLVGAVCLVRFYFLKAPPLNKKRESFPGVSIVKCCHSTQDREEENFDAFFNQDYPGAIQILFVVSTPDAPVVPIVRDFLQRYPHIDAQLLVSTTRQACWQKVDALFDGHQASKHEIIIWSDSDAVVGPSYVSETVASLEEPGVSVVTVPQYDIRVNNFASAFKVVGNTGDLATWVMMAVAFYKRINFGWGHSIGFFKREFDAIPGAWEVMNRFLADDQALPYLYSQNGMKVVVRNIYCAVDFANKTLAEVISQKRRWVWAQRVAICKYRYQYPVVLLAYPQIAAFLLLFLTGFAPWSVAVFFGVALVRIGIFALHEMLFERTLKMTVRWFWTGVLWDLSQVFFVLDALRRTTITFNGNHYRVVRRYFLEPEAQAERYAR